MSSELQPVSILLPDFLYSRATQAFEQEGIYLADAIETEPRIAYSMLRNCIRDAILEGRTRISDERSDIKVDRESDGAQAFHAVGRTALNILPEIGEDASIVTIETVATPNFWQWLIRKDISKEPKIALQFSVPAL